MMPFTLQNQSLAEEVLHSSVSQYGSVDTVCKVACEFVGYQTPGWVVAIYIALVIMTGGLAWRVMQCLPQRPLWSLQQCPLKEAHHVLVKV